MYCIMHLGRGCVKGVREGGLGEGCFCVKGCVREGTKGVVKEATNAVGTHPNAMHSCYLVFRHLM